MAANAHDVLPVAQHMVGANSDDRVMPDTELVSAIDGLASCTRSVSKDGCCVRGVLVSNECEFTPPLPMGITVRSCSDSVLQDGVLKFSSHRLAFVTPIMSWRYSRRLNEALLWGRRVSLPLPIFEATTVTVLTTEQLPMFEATTVTVLNTEQLPMFEATTVTVLTTEQRPIFEATTVTVLTTEQLPMFEATTVTVLNTEQRPMLEATTVTVLTTEQLPMVMATPWSRGQCV